MNSCLYSCRVSHRRIHPVEHAFTYRLFMFYLDLDELDAIDKRLRLVSRNHFNAYEYRDSDHHHPRTAPTRENIVSFLQGHDIAEKPGRIMLLTHLRTFGHVFNPVSFYFIDDQAGRPLCAIAEVANTFDEQKLYLIREPGLNGAAWQETQDKRFYVSPYSDLDTQFHFKLRRPADRLALSISQSQDGQPYFFSALAGERQPLTDRALLAYTLRFPLITLKVLGAIHWHALRLYLKRVPVRRKRSHPHLQTDKRPYLGQPKSAAR